MQIVTAQGAILDRILDESHQIWSDGLTRQAYARYNAAQLRTRWGAQHLERLALVDDEGRLLSSAKRYRFQIRLDGREVQAVGIGAVFTPAASRGSGHARALIEGILATAVGDGAALAVLFSEIDPDYYERMGFIPIPRHELIVKPKASRGAPMVLARVGEDRDVAAVAALARTMTDGRRFSLAPTEDSIRHSLAKKRFLAGFLPPGALSVEFYIVEEGASAVAFAIVTVTHDDAVLEMCGDRDPSGARVGALLQVLRARTPSEPTPSLACFLPAHWLPPQLEIEQRAIVREVMMVRPLVPDLLRAPLVEDDVLYWHGDLF